ncbi:MAG: ADP-heptose:LPS heptosyltransferase [Candidatus Azotimanducaceae bacterium]|jgi:ADP-heptose:LPS heptosyltransferase
MRILIVCAKHTGSNLFCTPAIRLLKKNIPDCLITVVALNKLSAEVFAGNPDISSVRVTQSRRQVESLAKESTVALCLNAKSKDLLAGLTCPVHVAPVARNGYHQADLILDFVADVFGFSVQQSDRQYVLTPSQPPESISQHVNKLIGIHLGCGKTAKHGWKFFHSGRGNHQKLWPMEHYIELGRLIRSRFPDHSIVLTGTANEAFLARAFLKHQPDTINLIGKTTAQSLVASIEKMAVFISHDCGVLHLAAATNTPLISMFACTFPEETGPYPPAPNRIVLQAETMAEILPEKVIDNLEKLIELKPEAA